MQMCMSADDSILFWYSIDWLKFRMYTGLNDNEMGEMLTTHLLSTTHLPLYLTTQSNNENLEMAKNLQKSND